MGGLLSVNAMIVIIVIAVGIGLYFWLTGGDGGSIIGGGSIPQPPALPK